MEIDYAITKPLWNLWVGFSLRTSDGLCVFTTYDADHAEFHSRRAPGHYTARCEIPRNLLSPSTYLISVNAGLTGIKNLARRDNVLLLDVEDTSPRRTPWARPGIVQPLLTWKQKSCDVWESSLVH